MSEDRVNQPTWNIQGSRVYGQGKSYQCTNIATAKELQCTLNQLTNIKETHTNIEQKLDKITQQTIQLKLTINTLHEEIKHLKELIK